MNEQVEQLQANTEDQLRQVSDTGGSLSNGIKTILEETASYSKRSMESTASFLQNLTNQHSIEAVVQLQTEYAQAQMQDFMGQFQRMSQIYQDMGKASFKPMESALAKGREAMHR